MTVVTVNGNAWVSDLAGKAIPFVSSITSAGEAAFQVQATCMLLSRSARNIKMLHSQKGPTGKW
jgi:hypothetical protein